MKRIKNIYDLGREINRLKKTIRRRNRKIVKINHFARNLMS